MADGSYGLVTFCLNAAFYVIAYACGEWERRERLLGISDRIVSLYDIARHYFTITVVGASKQLIRKKVKRKIIR